MSENVDRIARKVQRLYEESQGTNANPWKWPTFTDVVRFTLEAIKEPTDSMVEHAFTCMSLSDSDREVIRNAYRDMIDEMLRK